MSEEFTAETQQPAIIPSDDQPAPKQKRQLTEAQRLAFLKAREARARNIDIRREHKLAEEASGAPPTKKPRAKKTPKPNPIPVEVPVAATPMEVTAEPGVEAPPTDHAQETTEEQLVTENVISPAGSQLPDPTEYAKLVAEIIYEKLNSEPVEPPPPPKVKRQRVRKVKSEVDSDKEFEPEPLPVQEPPTKPFKWL